MDPTVRTSDRRALLDAKLTELLLLAKELCPAARVEAAAIQYEDEDGRVDVFPPADLSEDEVERLEMAIARRAGRIFETTGLFILCAVFDSAVQS